MRLRFVGGIGFALIVFFVLSTVSAYAQYDSIYGRKKSLKLEVKSAKMINEINKPVEINIFLRNITEESLELTEPAIDERSFMVEITMPEGKKDNLLDIYGLKLKTIRLYPKKRLKFKTEFIPETAGNYNIKVSYNGFMEEMLEAESITVFVVNPRGQY
ncbi:MAG: hypothetical protein L6416_06850 [Candidatus Omnitrophica bacterium]|nr:hypothetical protein [Candidatus Omnitrophota bacterium]